MTEFLRRFVGALVLDASVYEDRGRSGRGHAIVVRGGPCCRVRWRGAVGFGAIGAVDFIAGATLVIGAWIVWITAVSVIGTVVLAEPDTHSDTLELMRGLGFALTPCVFLVLAAMRSAAPLVLSFVVLWTMASSVVALRQSLDYRSTTRAALVGVAGWVLTLGIIAATLALLTMEAQ